MKLNEINIRDPFVLLHNGRYYMYGSRVGEQTGFDVYISDDLENWSVPKSVFERSENFWGTEDFWAPEVWPYEGKFYMLASFNSENKHRGTAILVSDSPDGLFEVHNPRITPEQWDCLDGTLWFENKTPYAVFCHEWTQVKNGEIWAVELSADLKSTVAMPFLLWRAGDAEWVCSVRGDSNYVTDGPFLFKTEEGKLKCLWSSFSRGKYVLASATSQNGRINGRWHIDKDLLYEGDGGHGMMFKTADGRGMLSLHSPNIGFEEHPKFIEMK